MGTEEISCKHSWHERLYRKSVFGDYVHWFQACEILVSIKHGTLMMSAYMGWIPCLLALQLLIASPTVWASWRETWNLFGRLSHELEFLEDPCPFKIKITIADLQFVDKELKVKEETIFLLKKKGESESTENPEFSWCIVQLKLLSITELHCV